MCMETLGNLIMFQALQSSLHIAKRDLVRQMQKWCTCPFEKAFCLLFEEILSDIVGTITLISL